MRDSTYDRAQLRFPFTYYFSTMYVYVHSKEGAAVKETVIWEGADLGKALRSRRKHLGILQTAAARDLGFSPRLVSEIERGRDTVAYGKILRYAGYLGMDVLVRERG